MDSNAENNMSLLENREQAFRQETAYFDENRQETAEKALTFSENEGVTGGDPCMEKDADTNVPEGPDEKEFQRPGKEKGWRPQRTAKKNGNESAEDTEEETEDKRIREEKGKHTKKQKKGALPDPDGNASKLTDKEEIPSKLRVQSRRGSEQMQRKRGREILTRSLQWQKREKLFFRGREFLRDQKEDERDSDAAKNEMSRKVHHTTYRLFLGGAYDAGRLKERLAEEKPAEKKERFLLRQKESGGAYEKENRELQRDCRYYEAGQDRELSRHKSDTDPKAKYRDKDRETLKSEHKEQDRRMQKTRQNKAFQKKKKEKTVEEVKQIVSFLGPIGMAFMILILVLCLFLVPFFIVLASVGGATGEYVTQNSYTTLAMTNEYFTDLLVQFEMFVSPGYEDNYEERLREADPEIYDFEYELPDEFTYNTVMLKAYLSSKYQTYDVTDPLIQADLDEVFLAYATYDHEIRSEMRRVTVFDEDGTPCGEEERIVRICTIKAEFHDFEELLKERLNDTQIAQFDRYMASGLGQAVFGPVLEGSWGYDGATYRVSSEFGYRVAPTEGASTYHGGIDIACPAGTPLYSAVTGTVELSGDSGNGGLRIKVRDDDTGISVVYMHLSELSVSAGAHVDRGAYIGKSGATGNVTGPHLHLEVHDPDGVKHDPRDYIPSNLF